MSLSRSIAGELSRRERVDQAREKNRGGRRQAFAKRWVETTPYSVSTASQGSIQDAEKETVDVVGNRNVELHRPRRRYRS